MLPETYKMTHVLCIVDPADGRHCTRWSQRECRRGGR